MLPVPDLSNLDAYHEIGVELNLDGATPPGDEPYRARYGDRLDAWNETYPLAPDHRFWPPA